MLAAALKPLEEIRWHLSPALAVHCPDPVIQFRDWLTNATIIKKGPQRTVVRVDVPGLSIFVKHHHLPDRLTRLRQCLRAPKAKREFDRLIELARRGVPAPQPLGWGTRPGWAGESFVITRAIDGVVPLNRLFIEPRLHPTQRTRLAAAIGRFVAAMHRSGVDHRDLHSGNMVVRQHADGFELFLVDLDAVRLGTELSSTRSVANLSLFAAGCLPATTRPDRLRFLRSYAYDRGWIDPARDAAGERALFHLARAIEHGAWRYNLTFWAHRDCRSLEQNRYYRRIKSQCCDGMAVRGVDEAWLTRFADDPEAMFTAPDVQVLKHSKSSTVVEIDVVVDGLPRKAILKKIGATRWTDPLAALVRPTPIVRSWVAGHGFLERNLPTPRPLAMVHRRELGLLHDGFLVTEKLEGVTELDDYVSGLSKLPAHERRRRLRRQIERVARAIREMHRRQISHRDLKAANILVTDACIEDSPAGQPRRVALSPFSPATTNLWFIDLVGTSIERRLSGRRRVQNLARLNASFLKSPVVTRSDRLRFLRTYLGWHIHGNDNWKNLWRRIAAATTAKVKRNEKSGRVLG